MEICGRYDSPGWRPRVGADDGLQKIPFVSVAEWEEARARNPRESDGCCGVQDGEEGTRAFQSVRYRRCSRARALLRMVSTGGREALRRAGLPPAVHAATAAQQVVAGIKTGEGERRSTTPGDDGRPGHGRRDRAAKADGRWEAGLRGATEEHPPCPAATPARARRAPEGQGVFEELTSQNRYAIL